MKKTELALNIVSIPVDAFSLLFAGVLSFYLRQNSISLVGPIIYQLNLRQFLGVVAFIIPVLILIFAFLGMYNLRGIRKLGREFGKIIIGVSLGLLLVIILFFFNQSIFPSRFIILATWGLGIIFVTLGRGVLKAVQEMMYARGAGLHRLVIIGGDPGTSGFVEKIYKNKSFGHQVAAELIFNQSTIQELESIFAQNKIDEILQANPALPDEANLQLVQFARNRGLQFSFVPNLFEVQRNAVETANLGGVPVISLKNTPLDGWGKVAKRILDVAASLAALIFTLPIFALAAIAIKLDSSGRVIYSALRGGCGRDFKFYKFRTMYSHLSVGDEYGGSEAEKVRLELWKKNDRGGAGAPFLKIKHDPRVTRLGRYLRRTKLDELPQFWNVLRGDMSLVGPRAHVIDEVERYRSRYRRMFSIKPGITGMSQLSQMSWPDLPFEEEIKLNTYYIENWSLWLDIKILVRTFWVLVFGSKPKEDY